MTLIKKHNLPFQELINGFFDNDIYGAPAFEHAVNSLPKVNLLEDDNGFSILIAAPGLSKVSTASWKAPPRYRAPAQNLR